MSTSTDWCYSKPRLEKLLFEMGNVNAGMPLTGQRAETR